MASRLKVIEQQQQSQQQQAALSATMEEFCRSIAAALDKPSFETKQRILRLVVDRAEVLNDQITIKHMIPISDVQLRRQPHVVNTPSWLSYSFGPSAAETTFAEFLLKSAFSH